MDSDHQADKAWLLSVQRKLYQWSREHPEEAYRDLWNWIIDPRNLRCAWRRVATNKGHRTPGVDGKTVAGIRRGVGEAKFLRELRQQLKGGNYRPSPCRRKLIPKRGKPGEFRPLGIPTIADRVVQSAAKQVLEPIFEAQFWHVSYGFRPGRSIHGALEYLRVATTPRGKDAFGKRRQTPYPWVIQADVRKCFDEISHRAVLTRLRNRVADRKTVRLIRQFLKAGVLAEDQFVRTSAGTPQGGVISPLLANIALSAIEERYERWVHKKPAKRRNAQTDGMKAAQYARVYDRRRGRMVCLPIRYADDLIILVSGSREQAEAEKNALTEHLRSALGLELSAEKTQVTPLTEGFEFLGHRVWLKWNRLQGYYTSLEIPKAKVAAIRHKVKSLTGRNSRNQSLSRVIRRLNPILRGWANSCRHCYGAHRVFSSLDWYVSDRLLRWLGKKYPKLSKKRLVAQFLRPSKISKRRVFQENGTETFLTGRLRVERYRFAWMRSPDYAVNLGEPDA